jgi:hypothetical protein
MGPRPAARTFTLVVGAESRNSRTGDLGYAVGFSRLECRGSSGDGCASAALRAFHGQPWL